MQTTLPHLIPGSDRHETDSSDTDGRFSALSSDPREKLIIALDVSSASAAQGIVAAVGDSALTLSLIHI